MAVGDHDECPACGSSTGGDAWCGVCGIDLEGDEARELRDLATELAAVEADLNVIWARRNAIDAELAGRRFARTRVSFDAAAPPGTVMFAPPTPLRARGEWGVERVRNLLLWTGAALLALSALAFTAVAWTHLGPAGRAALLVAMTAVSGLLASSLRGRLPATSGALTGLTITLALIDWQVARRAGAAPTLTGSAWWAIGSAVVAAMSVGLGRIAAPVPAHRAIAALVPGSAFLAVSAIAHAAWSGALGYALVAAGLAGASQLLTSRLVDRVARATLRTAAGAIWTVGAVLAIVAAFGPRTILQALTPAAVMLGFVLAPGLVLMRSRARETGRVMMAALVLAALIGAILTTVSTSIGWIGMLTSAAVLGCICVAIAPSLTRVWTRAGHLAGLMAAGPGLLFAITAAAGAELGPIAWLGHSWTGDTRARAVRVVGGPHTTELAGMGWCAVAILLVVAVAVVIATYPRRGADSAPDALMWQAGAVGLALLAVVLAPIAAGASAVGACAVAAGAMSLATIGSALAVRRHPERALPVGLLVVVPAIPASGWAALTRGTSIAVLVTAVGSGLIAAAVGRNASLRAAHAALGAGATVVLASVVTLATGGTRPGAACACAVVAGSVTLIGALARRDTADGLALEIVGAVGMVAGVRLAMPSGPWVAGTLTAMVPLLLGASTRRDRAILYGSAAGGAALTATWAWLATAGVTVVEAYTLPAAALALVAGERAWNAGRVRSWLSLGPALVLALAPTLVRAIARHDDGRAISVGIVAVVIVLIGARRQLQAPLVLGTITLLALGVDKLGPHAARMPRWMMLALAGALLLWVGTTFERRRDDVQRAARRFADLR